MASKDFETRFENEEDFTLRSSIDVHEYGKSITKHLTNLTKIPPVRFSRVNIERRSSNTPLYLDKRDHSRPFKESSASDFGDRSPKTAPFSKDYSRIVHSPAFRRLQGKSQLIPAGENEFFRTRLTHSIEVADIAARIAYRINNLGDPYFVENPINYELLSCTCLLHDIGHPPFGHSGEEVLNRIMGDHGGFEGNAQTLRLVSKLECRVRRGTKIEEAYESPSGLNLTVRTLASLLKYDECIPQKTRGRLVKGYYEEEADLVSTIKKALKVPKDRKLSTLECQIMDFADDIAYSAYDLEDTMEAGIVRPLDLISIQDDMLDSMVHQANRRIQQRFPEITLSAGDILNVLAELFQVLLKPADEKEYNILDNVDRIIYFGRTYHESQLHAKNPLVRRQFLETLIRKNIAAVEVELDPINPYLSKLVIDPERVVAIECLKTFNVHKVIASKRLQSPNFRQGQIVEYLFSTFDKDSDGKLLSEEEKILWKSSIARGGVREQKQRRMRFICDKVASLTDREAIQLYNKLNPAGEQSFFGYI